jgi:hypothetical protein
MLPKRAHATMRLSIRPAKHAGRSGLLALLLHVAMLLAPSSYAQMNAAKTGASMYADAMLLPLQLRSREAMTTLQAIDLNTLDPSVQATLACMRERFGAASTASVASSGRAGASKVAEAVIDAYRRYWHGALLGGSDPKALETASAALLVNLRQVLGEAEGANWEEVDRRLGQVFDAVGWHALRGITPPLRELIVWSGEDVVEEQASLPDGFEAVRVVFMSDFRSRGWADYATCGRSAAGGWTATDRLYAVADTYDRASERYRVSYLAHEGQHFRDKRRFKGDRALAAWRLEYRAKLAELALAHERQAELLAVFSGNTSTDPAFPHSHANQRVLAALDTALPGHAPWGAAASWPKSDADALRQAALKLLAIDDRALATGAD